MSGLSKLLVKLAKEGIIVELRPYDSFFDNNNIFAILIILYTSDFSNRIAGTVTFSLIEQISNIDIIQHKINELYKELKEKINNKDENYV